jgi:exopolysaccharide biosynthesis polyprenyl glycosylphosphotransferase
LFALAGIDFASAAVGSAVGYGVSSGTFPWAVAHKPLVLVLSSAWVVLVVLNGGFAERDTGARDDVARVFRVCLQLAVLVAVTSYATAADLPRAVLFIALPLALVLDLGGRLTARTWLRAHRAHARPVRVVLAVGDATAVRAFAQAVQQDPSAGVVVRGACLIDGQGDDADALAAVGVSSVGDVDSVIESARAIEASTVAVVSASHLGSERLRWITWQLERTGIELLVSPGLVEVAGHRLRVRSVAWMPLLRVEEPEFRGARRVLKELMDRLLALFITIALLPVFVVLFLAVRLSTPGPALFRQTRVGRDGRTFPMYKFRSMFVDAEARLAELKSENVYPAGPLFKVHNDPRITPVGRILRRYSLDELPQLINVLAGHMSLVGPRPPLPCEVLEYEADVRRRLLVKPGMTGLWQVSGRSDLSWAESVRLDLRYVENWTPALDLQILWKTAAAVLRGSGAY